MFKNAQDFCQRVWDDSFEVVSENNEKNNCFTFSFKEGDANPNDKVATFYEKKQKTN